YLYPANKPTGYIQQWSLGVERQLSATLLLNVTYVGNTGTHLRGDSNPNQAVPGNGPLALRRPFYATVPDAQDFVYLDQSDRSSYHGLQASLTQRFSNGVSFLTN